MEYTSNYNYEIDDMKFSIGGMDDNQQIKSDMRLGFIRKVYGILSIQLLITTIMTGLTLISDGLKAFIKEHVFLLLLMLILTIILPFIIICFPDLMRHVPQNYILLFIFTFAMGYVVASICAYIKPRIVFMAAFMTFCIVFTLTLYAITTKTDFTTQGGFIFILGSGVCIFVIFGIFTSNKWFHVFLCSICIILYGLYLVYDTQLVLGKGRDMIENDDYILASFMLYTDIIYLFLRVLELLGLLQGEN